MLTESSEGTGHELFPFIKCEIEPTEKQLLNGILTAPSVHVC
jgi:hypothetical protein